MNQKDSTFEWQTQVWEAQKDVIVRRLTTQQHALASASDFLREFVHKLRPRGEMMPDVNYATFGRMTMDVREAGMVMLDDDRLKTAQEVLTLNLCNYLMSLTEQTMHRNFAVLLMSITTLIGVLSSAHGRTQEQLCEHLSNQPINQQE